MMRSFVISLTIFCAISFTGLALQCLECIQKNSDTCVGVSVECPNSEECLVISELYHVGNYLYHSIKRSCNPGVPCNTSQYMSNFADKTLGAYLHCCTGDNCNTDNYLMPPEQTEHNGRLCTSCNGYPSEQCVSNRTIKCLKEEDKCFHYVGRIRDPGNNIQDYNIKGCSSPLACTLKFDGIIGVQEIQTDNFECSD